MKLLKKNFSEPFSESKKNELSQKFNVIPEVIELLSIRGIDCEDKIRKFLHPTITDLHNPFLLNGMKECVDKINWAIVNNKRVTIFGDYDVDGISAIAILVKFFESINFHVNYFMPNRFIDGYGLTNDSVDKVINAFNPDLIITVDCGISCYKEVEYIKSKGIEVIITDHHDIPEILPDTIIVNAKMPNQAYPFHEICGTGVALKIVQAMSDLETAGNFLPIASIATIADIVPLVDENRTIVSLGLKMMDEAPIGLKKLFKRLELNKITASDVSFKIAPKLNASGRLGDANISLQLYLETDPIKIEKIIDEILSFNTQRQDMCSYIYDNCIEMINRLSLADKRCIVLANEQWDTGVLGIIASRLTDEFYRPCFLFGATEDGFLSGSGRSIPNVNIHSVLTQLQDILKSFGGHTMAAGLKIERNNLHSFSTRIESILKENYDDSFFVPTRFFDIDIDSKKIDKNFVKQLEVLEPFGNENPKPNFRIKVAKTNANIMKNYPKHLTINLDKSNAVGFNLGKYYDLMNQNTLKEVIVELQLNTYKGIENHKIFFKDIAISNHIANNDISRNEGAYLANAQYGIKQAENIKYYDSNNIYEVVKDFNKVYGTLFFTFSKNNYENFIHDPTLNSYVVNYQNKELIENIGHNAIVFCPNFNNDFKHYTNFVFLEPVDEFGVIEYLQGKNTGNFWTPKRNGNCNLYNKIDLNRQIFGNYYVYLKHLFQKQKQFKDEYDLFKKLKNIASDINYLQLIACLIVFNELNIIKKDNNIYSLNEDAKTNLEDSKIYQFIKAKQGGKNDNKD